MTEDSSRPASDAPAQEAQGAAAQAAVPPGAPAHPCGFTLKNVLWVLFFLVLTVAARCANYKTVFLKTPDGGREIYFLVGDCYSRMERVRQVLAHGGVVHYHNWENYPTGIWPHTTAPLDYLIAGIALLLKPFMADYVDMAGAIVSPLLGLMTTAFLALWARELHQQYRRPMLLLVSLSPFLVHGQCLGRPDHHSLQIFLLAVGIGAELIMTRSPCIRWSVLSGAAWGLGLWVSLYEPLVLMMVFFLTEMVFYRNKLFVKERWWGLGVMLLILGVAWLLEGPYLVKSFHIEAHDAALRQHFWDWSGTIEEMKSVNTVGTDPSGRSVFYDLIFLWVGWGVLVAPILLIARILDARRAILLLVLLVTTFFFTMSELRWGYFFALIFAMSLPWQLSLFKMKWLVWTLFLVSLWPVARQWDYTLFNEANQDVRMTELNEQHRLREAAEFIGAYAHGGILAPWWWSPQLAYWSGQPALAGSSHESLSGIVDTSRFFAATDPKVAEQICKDRDVETIVVGNPEDIIDQSVQILGEPEPKRSNTMADILYFKPHSAPGFVHEVPLDLYIIKVFEVNHGAVVR